MAKKKLIKRLTDLFSQTQRKQCKHRDEIKKILRHLRKKEHALRDEIAQETDEYKRDKLQRKADVVHAQRLNGLRRLKAMDCG